MAFIFPFTKTLLMSGCCSGTWRWVWTAHLSYPNDWFGMCSLTEQAQALACHLFCLWVSCSIQYVCVNHVFINICSITQKSMCLCANTKCIPICHIGTHNQQEKFLFWVWWWRLPVSMHNLLFSAFKFPLKYHS